MTEPTEQHETATFGGGCFWCTESVFQSLNGVESVVSGYAGGHVDHPTYEQVCTGTTAHAEVIQVRYDPHVISFRQLMDVFFATHDPTTRGRQGNDVGTQYRSVIFYHQEQQQRDAEVYKRELEETGAFADPVLTEISPLTEFFPAEDYHQDYFARNPQQAYCQSVIPPKLQKLRAGFRDLLKEN